MTQHIYSDAAHRMSDIVTLAAALTGNVGKWCAIRMSDGGWDGVIYDHRREAVSHQFHEQLCCYPQIFPGGMTPQECAGFLEYHRAAYDAGFRLPDPEFQPPLMPLTKSDQQKQIIALTKKR